MSPRLRIVVDARPFERLEADVAAAGVFEDERPLRGGAGRIDWRLCALISELASTGRITGCEGEAILIPDGGRLGAPRILLIGLGPRVACSLSVVEGAVRELTRRSLSLGARTLALSPPGVDEDDFLRHAAAVLAGLIDAVREDGKSIEVRLSIPEEEAAAAARALAAAARSLPVAGLALDLPDPGELLAQPGARGRSRGESDAARPRSPQPASPRV